MDNLIGIFGKKNPPRKKRFSYLLKTSIGDIDSSIHPEVVGKSSILILGQAFLNGHKACGKDIVTGIAKYGKKISRHIDGDYLVIISKENELMIVNGRYDASRLYYHMSEKGLCFATSLKIISECSENRLDIDLEVIPSFLDTGFMKSEYSLLSNVKRILPTETITFSRGKITKTEDWGYEFHNEREEFNDLESHLDSYENIMRSGIKQYLKARRPNRLGMLLSGGHDTSFVFIQASKVFDKSIRTYTVTFKNWGFDEFPKAKYVSKKFGGTPTQILLGPEHLDLIPEIVKAVEEPVSGGILPMHLCAKIASGNVDVLMTGDAGDSLWAEFFPVAEWHRYIGNLPSPLRRCISGMSAISLKTLDWERLWEFNHVARLFEKKELYNDFFTRLSTYRHFDDKLMRHVLSNSVFPTISKKKCCIDLEFTKQNMYEMLIEAKMLYGVYLYMNLNTAKSFRYLGLDYFAPILNKDLIKFIGSLPKNWVNKGSSFKKLTNDGIKRVFHKMVLMRYLPKRIVYGVQQSFDVPWHSLLKKRPEILIALRKRLEKRGWYNMDFISKMFDEFILQEPKPHELWELKNHGYRIFSLLTLEIWCMLFLDKKRFKRCSLERFLEE